MTAGLTSFFQVSSAGSVAGKTSFFQITGAPVVTPAVAPTSVAGSPTGTTTAAISWTYSGSGESGFDVQLESPAGSGTWVTASGDANPTAPGVLTFTATGLMTATSYTPRVRTEKLGVSASAYTTGSAFTTDTAAGGSVPVPPLTSAMTVAGLLDPFLSAIAMGSVAGYRGDSLTASGVTGNCLLALANLPTENAVLFLAELISSSFAAGQLILSANGQYVVDPTTPNGSYSFTFRWYKDGAAQSPLVTLPILVGPSGFLTIIGNVDAFTAALAMTSQGGLIDINAALAAFTSSLSMGTTSSLSITASMNSFVSMIPMNSAIAGNVPEVLSISRQYKINPDVHLDGYSITQQFALTWAKDPDAELDYSLDWSDWLADAPGDSIANMYVNSTPDLTITAQALRGAVTAIVAGQGTVGQISTVTIRIVTSMGRVEERTITFVMQQR